MPTKAWQCDWLGSDTKDKWSFSVFGDSWQDAWIYGTVTEKMNSSKWVVSWDNGGQEFDIGTDKLLLELAEKVLELVDNDMESDDDMDNNNQMPQPKP